MIKTKEIYNNDEKQRITNHILKDLPEWFGIETSISEYIKGITKHKFILAEINGNEAGFISLNNNNNITAEIYLIAVYKKYHSLGIGTKLIDLSKQFLRNKGFKYLMVKTLSDSHPDMNYSKTRTFYLNMGFSPLQEIPEIWGKENPCLIMLQNI